jgi:hypothetical protein
MGIFVVLVALGGYTFLVLLLPSASSQCGNNVLREVRSPDGQWKVVVFERDCGAASDFSTQASLLGWNERLPENDGGNLFIADTNHGAAPTGPGGGPLLQVTWTGAHNVVLKSPAGARVFKAEARVRAVTAVYVLDAHR